MNPVDDLLPRHEPSFAALRARGHEALADTLATRCAEVYAKGHGDLQRWFNAYAALPSPEQTQIDLVHSVSSQFSPAACDAELKAALLLLHPWRKGPYHINGVHINTEWRSDWKWQRIANALELEGKHVLDVGCGNGYHLWRMLGAGAASVLGIDPTLLFMLQFRSLQKLLNSQHQADLLPIGIEAMPAKNQAFDTVFSMGVLYHRRSPMDHLLDLAGCLKPGGELLLETLVVEGEEGRVFTPQGPGGNRYAQMNNVWFLPTVATLSLWLKRCGYEQVRCIDSSHTTVEEQRSTEWMRFNSLPDFLDPLDHSKTREGYPAPLRASLIARKRR